MSAQQVAPRALPIANSHERRNCVGVDGAHSHKIGLHEAAEGLALGRKAQPVDGLQKPAVARIGLDAPVVSTGLGCLFVEVCDDDTVAQKSKRGPEKDGSTIGAQHSAGSGTAHGLPSQLRRPQMTVPHVALADKLGHGLRIQVCFCNGVDVGHAPVISRSKDLRLNKVTGNLDKLGRPGVAEEKNHQYGHAAARRGVQRGRAGKLHGCAPTCPKELDGRALLIQRHAPSRTKADFLGNVGKHRGLHITIDTAERNSIRKESTVDNILKDFLHECVRLVAFGPRQCRSPRGKQVLGVL